MPLSTNQQLNQDLNKTDQKNPLDDEQILTEPPELYLNKRQRHTKQFSNKIREKDGRILLLIPSLLNSAD